MKRELCVPHYYKLTVQALLLSSLVLVAASARAATQYLINRDFETPKAATNNIPNWTVGYAWGGPDDFEVKDRVTFAQGSSSFWGVALRPSHDKRAHAYFSQVVSNLNTSRTYTFSGYMYQEYWNNTSESQHDKYYVYIEALGSQGIATPDGRGSVKATTTTATDDSGGPYYYPDSTWRQYTGSQKPAADGTIEIRLHLSKYTWVESDKLAQMCGHFDNISLTYP